MITVHSLQITSALLAQAPHTGLWHFKCPTFGSVCSSFGPALSLCPCLLLLLLRCCFRCCTLCRLPRPLSPPCIPPSAPLPAAAGLSSGLSCCWCSLNPSQVEDVIEDRHWLSSCTAFTQSESHHFSTEQFRSLFHGGATPVFVAHDVNQI